MKILKICGVVVGIHLFALMLIFANPGCSSTSKSIPAPTDTMTRGDPGPSVSVPLPSNTVAMPITAPAPMAPAFNPDSPALAAGSGVRFVPTRPGTPAASTLVTAPVADVTPATTYTVANGDNLWSLSKKFQISTAEIAAANNLKTNAILHAGQKLIIPGKPMMAVAANAALPAAATKGAAAATPRPATEAVTHVVKAGESLSAIAQQYGVRQGDIAVANNITDPQKIRAGMELTIPGWQATTKSGKAAAPRPAAKSPPAKASDPRTIFSVEEATTAPRSNAPVIPIIRVDDGPVTPAAKAP